MRADLYLFLKGFAKSRTAAKELIISGAVSVDGKALVRPSEEIDENSDDIIIEVRKTETQKYVGRGGIKLEAAIKAFEIDAAGKIAVDIGASSGGFTDCLLSFGAVKVFAVDCGRGQLDKKLCCDSRVVSIEGLNARELCLADIGTVVDIAVMDVSFISQTLIIPNIYPLLKEGSVFISLIKPQFEAGRGALGKNGIVKDSKDRYFAAMRVISAAEEVGFVCVGFIASPIKGGDGNIEYLACFSNDKSAKKYDASSVADVIGIKSKNSGTEVL